MTNMPNKETHPLPATPQGCCLSNPQMAIRPDYTSPLQSIQTKLEKQTTVSFLKSIEYKVAVVVQRSPGKLQYRNIRAIAKHASSCQLTHIVLLGETDDIQPPLPVWLEAHKTTKAQADPTVALGDEEYDRMLERPDIDAVYVVVPPGSEQKYILKALQAKKHVLVKDPVSTYLGEFTEQLEYAKKYGKFIQFSTMFIHQYRVRRFMDRVLREELFGSINSIDATLLLNMEDVRKVGVKLPLGPQTGCIRSLGRYCVLFSALVFARVGSYAISAQVCDYVKGPNGVLQSATCKVKFTKDREVNFKVGYTNTVTRQSIAVKAESNIATMEDFVIEHPDGLASYRVYEKAVSETGKTQIVSGEAIDVAGGPTQDTMMWRTFVQLSALIDKHGWDHPMTAQCQELADVAVETKRILLTLRNSVETGCKEMPLTAIDGQPL